MRPGQGKVFVALSGGVDSAVTASLLLEQGYEVEGITMQVLSSPPQGREAAAPAQEAAAVAAVLGIPHHVVHFEEAFQSRVIAPFREAYRCGRTPNPCALCNRLVKFGLLREEAARRGAALFATGHYARILDAGDRRLLAKGVDPAKDQSYFLFLLTQEQLRQTLFPLGDLTKERVRRMAADRGLRKTERGESQDICFIGAGGYVAFLETSEGTNGEEGEILHVSGRVLGRHRGIHRYTVGQRRGLGLAWPEPLYVIRVEAERNALIVGERSHLAAFRLEAAGVQWIWPPPEKPLSCRCRIRYRHREAEALVSPQGADRVVVEFLEPQYGITPGQAAVFYQGEYVMGGGWIV
jgi:tRNA-specific 2-thiouridylase